MKHPYQLTGLAFVLFGGFTARESLGYEFYTFLGPGPGLFPFWLSVLLMLMGAIMAAKATFLTSEPMPEGFIPSSAGYLRVAAIILSLAGATVLIQPLGYRLTMLGFLVLLLSALGRQHPLIVGVVSLVGSFGLAYVFTSWLKVPLPTGVFGI